MIPSIDHSLLSPSGRVSKRARKAALKREQARLFPPGYWEAIKEENKKEMMPSIGERVARLKELARLASPLQAKKLLAKADALKL